MERGKCVNIEKSDRNKNNTKQLNDLDTKEKSKIEYIDQLERENRCLKRANVSVEHDNNIWRKNYKEMESKAMRLLKQQVVVNNNRNETEHIQIEPSRNTGEEIISQGGSHREQMALNHMGMNGFLHEKRGYITFMGGKGNVVKEVSSRKEREEIIREPANTSEVISSEPEPNNGTMEEIRSELQHIEVPDDLDGDALPPVVGDKNNPVEISDGEDDSEWAVGIGTTGVKIEGEDKMEKCNAGQNVLLGCFSMEMQTPGEHMEMNGSLHDKVGTTTFMGEKENAVEEVNSIGKGENWGKYILEGDSHVAFSHGMVICNKEPEWISWPDLYLSLVKSPELCLKAVCALCRQHALKKKPEQDSLVDSAGFGFSPPDEVRGMQLCKFLLEGNLKGDLKKSVEELEKFGPTALQDCKRLAKQYSEQLFNIYQAAEDPFFSC